MGGSLRQTFLSVPFLDWPARIFSGWKAIGLRASAIPTRTRMSGFKKDIQNRLSFRAPILAYPCGGQETIADFGDGSDSLRWTGSRSRLRWIM